MTRRYTGGFFSAKEQATDANSANGIFTLQEAGQATAVGSFPTGNWTPQKSLRFRSSGPAALTRTNTANGSATTFTWSAWVKRAQISTTDRDQWLFHGSNYNTGTNQLNFEIVFRTGADASADCFSCNLEWSVSGTNTIIRSSARLKDPAAWYHLMVVADTTNAIASDRIRLFINGSRVTDLQSTPTWPSQNQAININQSGMTPSIGAMTLNGSLTRTFDGYMSEVNFVDGQALYPASFGQTDAETGVWTPKRYTGSYGTNGFYLDFRDASAASATAIGADRSGNGNNWTPTGISVASGVTYDSSVDVPGICSVTSQPEVGGVQRGNYCTWNPIMPSGNGTACTFSNGNMTVTNSSSAGGNGVATMSMTGGKWYFEGTASGITGGSHLIGIFYVDNSIVSFQNYGSIRSSDQGWFDLQLPTSNNTSATTYTANGSVVGVAFDVDAGKCWFSVNGVWVNGGDPISGVNPAFTFTSNLHVRPWFCFDNQVGTKVWDANFGQRPYAYACPTGFKSICTTNLPNPVIKVPKDHFQVKTYSGNGSSLTVGNVNRQSSGMQTRGLRIKRYSRGGFNRTPTATGNSQTFSFSAWFKLPTATSATRMVLFNAGETGGDGLATHFFLSWSGYSQDYRMGYISGGGTYSTSFNAFTFKDTQKWHHVLFVSDTTNAVGSNRWRCWIDGLEQSPAYTNLTGGSLASPPQNWSSRWNTSGYTQRIGFSNDNGRAYDYDGYLAEVYNIDGSAKSPTDFGQFDANNNWVPKAYSGSYGTNGFYLPFNASSASTYGGLFNGSSSAVSVGAGYLASIGTGDFTIECFINASAANASTQDLNWPSFYERIWSFGNTTLSDEISLNITNTGGIQYRNNDTLLVDGSQWPIGPNGWNHVAVVRSSGTTTVYVNGESVNSTTTNNDLTGRANGTLWIGNVAGGGVAWFKGYISNFRVVKAAVYTSNFVPPTGNLTAIANTTLLTLQNNSLVDNSGQGRTLTAYSMSYPAVSPFSASAGTDGSGQGNHFKPQSINLEPGYYNDALKDAPTDWEVDSTSTDAGGEVGGNYATLSSNDIGASPTFRNANLTLVSSGAAAWRSTRSTHSMGTGKWYAEFTPLENTGSGLLDLQAGIVRRDQAIAAEYYNNANAVVYSAGGGTLFVAGSNVGTVATITYGDTLGIAFDADMGTVQFYKNGSLLTTLGVGDNGNYEWQFCLGAYSRGDGTVTVDSNFGQRAFRNAAPAGYMSLNSRNMKKVAGYNLPDNTGNFVNTPDLVWLKCRSSGSYGHRWTDSVRGPRNQLLSHDTGPQSIDNNGLQEFLPNGFRLDSGQDYNKTGETYVSWAWNRGQIPGFEIVQYNGGASPQRVRHNLGQTPSMMIVKGTSFDQNWLVYHQSLGSTKWLQLNTSVAALTETAIWNDTPPTNYDFTIGSSSAINTGSCVAYLWAQVPGFSQFGSYTGNGSSAGPFVQCGFRPAFVMMKSSSAIEEWVIVDTKRDPSNTTISARIYPHLASAENNAAACAQMFSNGFMANRSGDGTCNVTGRTYIYAAFAENPFKYANAR